VDIALLGTSAQYGLNAPDLHTREGSMATTRRSGGRPLKAARNSFPIAHRLLAAVGVIVPPRVAISGNFRSTRGVLLDTDRATLAPGTTVVPNGRIGFIVDRFGVKGTWECTCESGSGSCGFSTFPGRMVCTKSGGCTACKIRVSIPGNLLPALVLKALDLRLERGATAVGDITRGAVVTSGGLRVGRDSPIRFLKDATNPARALMIGAGGQGIQGDFSCSCDGVGLCALDIRGNGMLCTPLGACIPGCKFKIRTPALQLSLPAFA
jgi:hypothetical protein